MRDGEIRRELAGPDLNKNALVSASLGAAREDSAPEGAS
jgi:hypothetical protein